MLLLDFQKALRQAQGKLTFKAVTPRGIHKVFLSAKWLPAYYCMHVNFMAGEPKGSSGGHKNREHKAPDFCELI